MSNIKPIRERLGMTQAALGEALGVTQGNVSFYERGQTVPPHIARRLIEVGRNQGLALTFDDVYSSPEGGEAGAEAATPAAAA